MDTVIKMIDILQKGEKMDDLISRQAAVKVIDAVFPVDPMKSEYAQGIACGAALAKTYVEQLPAAQPEIIRCGQCKYAEVADKEDTQDGYTCQFHRGSIWFSGSYCSWAERRTE